MTYRMLLLAVLVYFIASHQVIAYNINVPSADYIICVDGDDTKTSLQIINKQGEIMLLQGPQGVVKELCGPGGNVVSLGWEMVQENLEKLLATIRFVHTYPVLQNKAAFAVVAGFAGAGNQEVCKQLAVIFRRWGIDADKIVITTNIEIAKELLHDKEEGAILISGAGSIAFIKHQGQFMRLGGLGWYLSDEGSGFSIGKKAIAAAIADQEGAVGQTILTPMLQEIFQRHRLYDIIPLLQNGTIPAYQVANLAPKVFECAYEKKDPVACFIVKLVAQELAGLVRNGLEVLQKNKLTSLHNHWPIYLIGGQFQGKYAPVWMKELWFFLPQRGKMTPHNIAGTNTTSFVVQKKIADRKKKR
eukprot:gene582-727_t